MADMLGLIAYLHDKTKDLYPPLTEDKGHSYLEMS